MNSPKMEFATCKSQTAIIREKSSHIYTINSEVFENYQKFAMETYKTNVFMCGLFMSSSIIAAIHLGLSHTDNLEVYKNARFEEIQNLFDITRSQVLENQEILNVESIGSEDPSWTRSTLLKDQAIKWTKTKVVVYSDSVLCL